MTRAVWCFVALSASLLTSIPQLMAADAVPVKKIYGDNPSYPPMAKRFNVQGQVLVTLTIDVEGNVIATEVVQSPADILSEEVRNTLREWKFTKPDKELKVGVPVPFKLSGGDYAFDSAIRTMTFVPTDKSQVSRDLLDGEGVVRLMIGSNGTIDDGLILRTSSQAFVPSLQRIVAVLKFSPSSLDAKDYKATAVNQFSVKVRNRSTIEVVQASGE